ncbi:plakophilin-1 isoform X1 [Oreochromis aureus]|nr:plakophilin-1 isoform X1 [Oreochromis aureus]XP_039460914.1 plakophilin-1 isoform X1 [Oreochromis aureus]CAI5647618.1 unnamed protein product [Mustela putorius furo]
MMAPEPLRSATTMGGAEDTSLALPSDNKLRLGQQRVLDQVHSIKRSKSKHGKSVRAPSPTSPPLQSFTKQTDFASFKYSPSKANGNFHRSKSTMSAGTMKETSRTLSTRNSGGRYMSTSGVWEEQINASTWPKSPNGIKPSKSDPALAPPFSPAAGPSMRIKGQMAQGQSTFQTRTNRHSVSSGTNGNAITSSQSRIVRMPSTQSQNEGKMGTMKMENKSMMNIPDPTLKEAVEFLSSSEESYQQWGATFIQHTTYTDESAKSEVFQLGGIPTLVTLLRSGNPQVCQVAAGALRNLAFKNQNNKLEVQRCGGIAKALQLLKETDSTETQKQITGLLWNLSSANELKQELTATALPALTQHVVVPYTSLSDTGPSSYIDPSVFNCATGCLRNLSSGKDGQRQTMRSCPGLIDSLMSYMKSCVAEENPDDSSLENCACILHNLSYKLEQESSGSFSNYNPSRDAQPEKSPTIGCFSPKSSKAQKTFSFDTVDASPPSGVKWLSHPNAIDTYLSLLESSENKATLEACCGALQNLTATKGNASDAVSQILVSKSRDLSQFGPLLKPSNPKLQNTALSLLGNMSRTSSVQGTMAKQILPQLGELLQGGPSKFGNSDESIAAACLTVVRLMSANSDTSKKVITNPVIQSLTDLSENKKLTKGSNAASLLLYSIWQDKNLQSAMKKMGLTKSAFINDNITKVVSQLEGQ